MTRSKPNRRSALATIGASFVLGGCSWRDSSSTDRSQAAQVNEFQPIVESFADWRKQNSRVAYRPITTPTTDGQNRSQFGGIPSLAIDDDWPQCGRCSNQMTLLLQLDLTALPVEHPHLNSGLLQVFYCAYTNFEENQFCDDSQAFSPCHKLRVIANENLSLFDGDAPAMTFPTAQIQGWRSFTDYPSSVEHERLGLRYEYDFESHQSKTDVHWDAGDVHFTGVVCANDADSGLAEAIAHAASKDKLFGWPMWIQNVDYPSCPKCQRAMTYFFQIDSQNNLPYMFGDVGCGHISYCQNHPDVLAFSWACA